MDTLRESTTGRMAEQACHECRRRKSKVSRDPSEVLRLGANCNIVQSDHSFVSAMQQVWQAVHL